MRAAPDTDATIAALVTTAKTGDHAALASLHTRYARMVHGILLARVHRQEVDDLVQEAFLRAIRALPDLREAGAFGGWLATLTRRLAAEHHRGARPSTSLPPDLADRPTAGPDAAQRAKAVHILAMIRRLPVAYRETLVLRLVEGLTGPEIAAGTGMTAGSVRVNLHRGMTLLRAALADDTDSREDET